MRYCTCTSCYITNQVTSLSMHGVLTSNVPSPTLDQHTCTCRYRRDSKLPWRLLCKMWKWRCLIRKCCSIDNNGILTFRIHRVSGWAGIRVGMMFNLDLHSSSISSKETDSLCFCFLIVVLSWRNSNRDVLQT